MCPHCGSHAPLVYRGLEATCSACGRARLPLTGASLTHAGKGARVGGAVLGALGWVFLFGGLAFAALVGLIAGLIGGAGWAAGTVGVFAALTLGFFWGMRRGSQALEATGEEARDARAEEAMFALAKNRGGRLEARFAASALALSLDDADRILTALAKRRPEEVDLQIGDRGELYFTFLQLVPASRVTPRTGARVSERVRVASEPPAQVRPISTHPPVYDAEFEEIEADAPARRVTRR